VENRKLTWTHVVQSWGVCALLLLALGVFLPNVALAAEAGGAAGEAGGVPETTTIGRVTRVQGTSFLVRGSHMRDVTLNATVHRGESVRTGPLARVELTMLDETKLTLAADTVFDFERYDLGSQRGTGAVLLRLGKGAFRTVTGKLDALRGGTFEIASPLGTIGIRGTDFWGGYLNADEVSLLLVSGKAVYLRTDAGTSEIVRPGEGLTVRSRTEMPPAPILWSPEKVARAFKTVSFD